VTINDDGPLVFDSSSDDSDFEADYMAGHRDSYCEVGNGSQVNIEMSEPNEACSDNDSYVSEELRSPISTDDEGDGDRNIVYPQFNENAGFGQVSLDLEWSLLLLSNLKMLLRITPFTRGRILSG